MKIITPDEHELGQFNIKYSTEIDESDYYPRLVTRITTPNTIRYLHHSGFEQLRWHVIDMISEEIRKDK